MTGLPASGLKINFDRFRHAAEDLIREMKQDADRFIAHAKETIATNRPEQNET